MTAQHVHGGHTPDGFAHTAVIVHSDRSLRNALIPRLRQSLQVRKPVLMVVSDHTATMVRQELGERSRDLEWGDSTAFYQRLGFAYESFRRYLADQHAAGRHVHVIAEPDITADPDQATPIDRAAAYLAYESVCNDTYAPYGSAVTCIWDSRRHPDPVIEGARSVHNYELTGAGTIPSRTYVTPEKYLAARNDIPLEDVPKDVDQDLQFVDVTQLGRLRLALRSSIDQHPFAEPAADDIILSVTEVAANGLAHGAAPVRVRVWHHGDALVVHLDDRGGQPLPPDAGYRRSDLGETPGGGDCGWPGNSPTPSRPTPGRNRPPSGCTSPAKSPTAIQRDHMLPFTRVHHCSVRPDRVIGVGAGKVAAGLA
jgi:anti-sigma regulatory factor (Ser/Thr protein kinase)